MRTCRFHLGPRCVPQTLPELFAGLSRGICLARAVLPAFCARLMGKGHAAGSAVAPFWQYLVLSIATIGPSWLTLVGVERQFNRGRAVLGRGPAALPTTTATPQRAL